MNRTAAKPRTAWIDILRGIAVLLVVSTHTVSILIGAELFPSATANIALEANRIFWPFRMPLLVFLSGLFVVRSYQKGTATYLIGKVRHVAWPYIVWSLLMILRANGWDPFTMASIAWRPYSTLWFLYYLFAFYILFVLIKKIPIPIAVVAAFLISWAAPPVPEAQRFFYLFAFFLAGCWLSTHLNKALVFLRKPSVLIITAIPTVLTGIAASKALLPLYDIRVAPLALIGIAFAIGLAQWLRPGKISAALSYVGRHSLIYFVVHPLSLIFILRLMRSLDVPASSWWYPSAFIAYVAVATTLSWLSDRSRLIHAFFVMPRLTTRKHRPTPRGKQSQARSV